MGGNSWKLLWHSQAAGGGAFGPGPDVILEIDVQGGLQVQKIMGSRCILIFIVPPSEEELFRRLKTRNREKDEEIALRLKPPSGK